MGGSRVVTTLATETSYTREVERWREEGGRDR